MEIKYTNIRACVSIAALFAANFVFVASAAENDMTPVDVVGMGTQVLQQMDGGQTAGIWDNASDVLKSQVTKEQFTEQSNARKRGFTASGDRAWVTVSRNRFPQAAPPAPPAGLYANVVFVTPGAAGSAMSELISFRLENDNRWRVVGYVPDVRK